MQKATSSILQLKQYVSQLEIPLELVRTFSIVWRAIYIIRNIYKFIIVQIYKKFEIYGINTKFKVCDWLKVFYIIKNRDVIKNSNFWQKIRLNHSTDFAQILYVRFLINLMICDADGQDLTKKKFLLNNPNAV